MAPHRLEDRPETGPSHKRYFVRAALTATAMAAAMAATAGPVLASTATAATPAPASATAQAGKGAAALARALTQRGKPYVWGAAGPNAYDCSGLVVWAFKQVGVALPHSSRLQSGIGTPVSRAALQPGDLVFFYSPVSHVGIYAGGGNVLHASQPGQPVKISPLASMPFHNARRI
ncbi:NlpC/P60 family protein [Amycolatopsis sp. FDAARGOS 1241]|uniref:NlpC/P60 family protein n=1 Tax=Amycolatopsis sp. FDAARGOS 1241 TaxID=2778070 RepID=UPI00194E3AC0|nr:NlpC/P60 family protein [Amycolatopsis sp. FDAARGOS 1241]QRP46645.1 C40 family peptidase [Amycolatopsis sp. FDAARGOS 1241]